MAGLARFPTLGYQLVTSSCQCKDVQGENINKIISAVVKVIMDVGEETLPTEAVAIRLTGFVCLKAISSTFYQVKNADNEVMVTKVNKYFLHYPIN